MRSKHKTLRYDKRRGGEHFPQHAGSPTGKRAEMFRRLREAEMFPCRFLSPGTFPGFRRAGGTFFIASGEVACESLRADNLRAGKLHTEVAKDKSCARGSCAQTKLRTCKVASDQNSTWNIACGKVARGGVTRYGSAWSCVELRESTWSAWSCAGSCTWEQ